MGFTVHPDPGRANLRSNFFCEVFFGTMMILRGSLLTQGVTSSSRAWTPWVSSETLMILNLRGSAVFTLWSNLELGQRKNELLASHYIKLVFKLSGKLEISSYFDQLSANIGKGWSTSSATSVANVLKRKSTLQYTKLELMTNDLSHVRSVEKLQLESQLTTITWESTPMLWQSQKHPENVISAHMKPQIQPTWRNTLKMFTKRSQRGTIIWRNAMTAEKLFLAKIIWIDMLRSKILASFGADDPLS